MPTYESFDGLQLFYEDTGSGRPVVLLHSFPFDCRVWTDAGVVPALVAAGRRVIAPDRRGHGRSARPHEPAAYADNASARDVSCLLDHLDFESVDLLGYSLGSHIGLRVIQTEPRIRRAVLGGVGDGVFTRDLERAAEAARRLEIDDPSLLDDRGKELFELVARLEGDRHALAAELRSQYVQYDPDFSAVSAPVLIITGVRDESGGDPMRLAGRIPLATVERIDADHASTMDHPDFVRLALSFFGV
jgi:pimeloyl-ACP methyl ester carboxylesterase